MEGRTRRLGSQPGGVYGSNRKGFIAIGQIARDADGTQDLIRNQMAGG